MNSHPAQSQSLVKAGSSSSPLPPLFFDAEVTHFDREGIFQNFEGNVVTMVGGSLVWADKLSLDRSKDTFFASGHVLVVNGNQVFGGDEITYNFRSEDFFLTNAFVISEDPKRANEIAHKILGITAEEVQFELDKTQQIKNVQEQKENLKKRYTKLAPSQKEIMIEQYSVLLEKEQLISTQLSPNIASIGQHARDTIIKRREFWEESKKSKLPIGQPLLAKSYTRLDGAWIERTDGNHYRASKIALTPCLCEEGEKPAWQIRADTLDAYGEGYADLSDAVIEVKGVPILYLPYLRLPMKGQRQSGFLPPSLSYNRFNGSVLSQSVFFDLGANKDSTMTVDFMEKRGTRFGAEYRYQQKTFSGWELQAEGIRDRQWLTLQDSRAEISRAYSDGLSRAVATQNGTPLPPARNSSYNASILSQPSYWNSSAIDFSYCMKNPDSELCKDLIASIKAPGNTFRYKTEWKGMTFLTPRLSFVSDGKVLSDHRYLQDLYFDKFSESFNPETPALFTKTRAQMHLDGNDFYAGLGSSWGDQLQNDSRYSGHQNPVSLRLRSRTFTLFETPRPMFASLMLNYKKIDYFEDGKFRLDFPDDTTTVRLDSGNWTQGKANFLMPLFTHEVFLLNYFTELEARIIETHYRNGLTVEPKVDLNQKMESTSNIRTLRLGLDFQLPIDGTMQLSPSDTLKSEGIKYLNHRMLWGITYSLRPSVVRKGPYSQIYSQYKYDPKSAFFLPDTAANAQRLTYFASESPENFDSDLLSEPDRMNPHNLVIFSTSHDWITYKKNWNSTLAPVVEEDKTKPIRFSDRARNDLEHARYLTQTLDSFLTDADAEQNGFNVVEGEKSTMVHFDGTISYDYKKEQERRKRNQEPQTATNSLLNPWSPARGNASLNLYDWTLANFTKYDLYAKVVTELRFQLSPPTVYKTKLSLGYSIEKEVNYQNTGGINLYRTLTRSYGLTSTVIPYVSLFGEYSSRTKEQQDPSQMFYASAGASYASPSNCWGLQFSWRKDYPERTWTGTYYLSLIVKFFNYSREYSNLLSKANKN